MAETLIPSALAFLKSTLERKGVCRIRVFGNSMSPTLRDGDLVEIRLHPFHLLMPGQIIAFSRDGKIYIHRIRYKTSLGVLAAGDANLLLDEPVTEEDYLGLVTARVRPDGSLEPLHALCRDRSVSSISANPLVVLLPDWLYEQVTKRIPRGQTFILQPFHERDSTWMDSLSPTRAIGISPYGLLNEREGLDLMTLPGLQYLVCLANFGPEGSGLFPVSKLRGVVRMQIFDHLPDPYAPEAVQYLLGYLDGILNFLLGNGFQERGGATCG